ncbi:hypothetical protein C8R44DRAFT_732041 [Mycena epipterygia]|nr:hypothetical protein C8R44DRAFT_732041 [Mycena epipterygia]
MSLDGHRGLGKANVLLRFLIQDILLSGAQFTTGSNNAQFSDLSKIMYDNPWFKRVEKWEEYVMVGFQIGSAIGSTILFSQPSEHSGINLACIWWLWVQFGEYGDPYCNIIVTYHNVMLDNPGA